MALTTGLSYHLPHPRNNGLPQNSPNVTFSCHAGQEIFEPPFQSCPKLSCFGTELGPPLILTSAALLFASGHALLFSIAFTVPRNTKKSFFLQSYVEVRTVCLVSASLVKSGSTEYLTNSQMPSTILSALCVSDFLFNLISHSFIPFCMS